VAAGHPIQAGMHAARESSARRSRLPPASKSSDRRGPDASSAHPLS
jgi:hypothetical protein